MNVFEDLLVELKEENLLEETVALLPVPNGNGNGLRKAAKPSPNGNGNGNGNGHGNGHKNGSSLKQKASEKNPGTVRTESRLSNPSDQMSALQFVDFVISSAERLDGGAGLPFDELQVQKAFHRYTQASNDPDSDECFEAESALVDSLRSWEDDLVRRDTSLSVGTLRRYTESANPPLSSGSCSTTWSLCRTSHSKTSNRA